LPYAILDKKVRKIEEEQRKSYIRPYIMAVSYNTTQ